MRAPALLAVAVLAWPMAANPAALSRDRALERSLAAVGTVTADHAFVDAAGNDFLPADGSVLIDSAINSINDRDFFVTLRARATRLRRVRHPDRDHPA